MLYKCFVFAGIRQRCLENISILIRWVSIYMAHISSLGLLIMLMAPYIILSPVIGYVQSQPVPFPLPEGAYNTATIWHYNLSYNNCHLCPTRYPFTPEWSEAREGKVPYPRTQHWYNNVPELRGEKHNVSLNILHHQHLIKRAWTRTTGSDLSL